MIRSMTAFGCAKEDSWFVEIHSVNRKSLDISLALPAYMLFYDLSIRKMISQDVHRGQVTVRVGCDEKKNSLLITSSLKTLKSKWDKIAKDLKLDPHKEVTLSFLLERRLEDETLAEEKTLSQILNPLLKKALKDFIAMREKEGLHLLKDIQHQLNKIKSYLTAIEKKVPAYEKKYVEDLKKQIQLLSSLQDEDKILKEVITYLKKIDVHEEIIRLYSHIKQFEELLMSQQTNIGKTLDVLVQEMNRETNTLIAKMADTEILKLAIQIKSCVNKLQEQVQNIE